MTRITPVRAPFGCLLALFALALGSPVSAAPGKINFNRDIRPILSSQCFACHGFDAKKRKADLRLDTAEGAFAPRTDSVAIKPKDLAGSELWQRITSDDPTEVMPPPETKKTLTPQQKELIKK